MTDVFFVKIADSKKPLIIFIKNSIIETSKFIYLVQKLIESPVKYL